MNINLQLAVVVNYFSLLSFVFMFPIERMLLHTKYVIWLLQMRWFPEFLIRFFFAFIVWKPVVIGYIVFISFGKQLLYVDL